MAWRRYAKRSRTTQSEALRKKRESLGVARTDNGEVPSIQRGDFGDVQAFGQGYYGRVGDSERQVGVLLDQLGHPCVVLRSQVDRFEVAVGYALEEPGFDVGVTVMIEEVADLSSDRCRQEESALGKAKAGQQLVAGMVGVVLGDRGSDNRTSVEDDHGSAAEALRQDFVDPLGRGRVGRAFGDRSDPGEWGRADDARTVQTSAQVRNRER